MAEPELHVATRAGVLPLMRGLLDSGAEVEARDDAGLTALHRGAINSPLAVCELLLDRGADVNARDDAGRTPLHLAALRSPELCRLLLERGATASLDNRGTSPIHRAIFRMDAALVAELASSPAFADKRWRADAFHWWAREARWNVRYRPIDAARMARQMEVACALTEGEAPMWTRQPLRVGWGAAYPPMVPLDILEAAQSDPALSAAQKAFSSRLLAAVKARHAWYRRGVCVRAREAWQAPRNLPYADERVAEVAAEVAVAVAAEALADADVLAQRAALEASLVQQTAAASAVRLVQARRDAALARAVELRRLADLPA